MKNTMKAALIKEYKQEFPTIENVAIPETGDNDVLIKIVAASINPIDIKTKDGGLKVLLKYDMPLIMGSDFSGIVVKVGKNVKKYSVGDPVYGRVEKNRIGTYAEYIAVSQNVIAPKPETLSFEEAASIPLVGLTSYQALHDIMQVKSGDKVLIQAGSGGIGTIAIQIAKMLGAYVATTTTEDNFELVKSLGADVAIDFRTQNFVDVLSDYDYVFDTQGGQILENAFKIIKPGGKVVSINGVPNARFTKEYKVALWKNIAFRYVSRNLTKLEKETGAEYRFLFMRPDGEQLETLGALLDEGTLKPVIDRVIPFNDLTEALKYSRSGQAVGKIIIKIGEPTI